MVRPRRLGEREQCLDHPPDLILVGAAAAADPAGPIAISRGDDPRSLARDGLVELGYPPPEAEALLNTAEGESAEDLIASALRGARR